jgi:hypothetical protein
MPASGSSCQGFACCLPGRDIRSPRPLLATSTTTLAPNGFLPPHNLDVRTGNCRHEINWAIESFAGLISRLYTQLAVQHWLQAPTSSRPILAALAAMCCRIARYSRANRRLGIAYPFGEHCDTTINTEPNQLQATSPLLKSRRSSGTCTGKFPYV